MKKSHLYFLLFLAALFTSCSTENEYEDVKEDDFINTDKDSLVIAHWNIGHFSNGKSFNTTITSENFSEKQMQYINAFDSIKADIIGLCEYNPYFSEDGNLAQDAILYKYKNATIGPKHQYNCNAIFSKDIPLYNGKNIGFTKSVQHRYMQCSDIKVNNVFIRLIETHLDWNQGYDGAECRRNQIQELIDITKDLEYVIICADYNVSNSSEYDPFKDASFSLANYEESGKSSSKSLIDNIIVKGLTIQSFDVLPFSGLSDHSILKCCISLIK